MAREIAIKTETNSPIESGIDRSWGHYAHVDDGEHALVVGVDWASDDRENTTKVEYAVYVCEAGLVDELEKPATHLFDQEPRNLADAAVQLLESVESGLGEHALDISRGYWA